MFFEIIYGHPPWQAKSIRELLKKLKEEPIEQVITQELKQNTESEDIVNE